MAAKTMAWSSDTDRDPTDVAHELATSLAPGESDCQLPPPHQVFPGRWTFERTNVPRIEEGKDGGDGEDVVELMENHRVGFVV